MPASARQVQLIGSVNDERPSSVTVTFGGQMTGAIHPDSNGYFSYTAVAGGLGTVTAVATDDESLTSNTATADISSNAPSVSLMVQPLGGRHVRITGTVQDESPGGLTVTLGGVVSGTTTTWSDGHFSVDLDATALGTVTAVVSDAWGLTSSQAATQLSVPPPSISDFSGSAGVGGYWTFSGKVNAWFPGGMTVTLSGLPSLNNVTVTTDEDGYFSFTVQLNANDTGTATARVTDAWGQTSDAASWLIGSSGQNSGPVFTIGLTLNV